MLAPLLTMSVIFSKITVQHILRLKSKSQYFCPRVRIAGCLVLCIAVAQVAVQLRGPTPVRLVQYDPSQPSMCIAGCVLLCISVAQVGPRAISCALVPPFIVAHAHCRLCGPVRGCGAGGRYNSVGPPLRACSNMTLAITAHALCRLCGAVRGCGASGREP